MRKISFFTFLILALIESDCKSQCNFYLKFYNSQFVERVENLLWATNNQYYAVFVPNYTWSIPGSIGKLDVLGDTLWTKQYCGNTILDLQYSLDSNLVGVNDFFPNCGTTIGYHDIAFYKFSLNGDTIFTSRFGTTGGDSNPSLAVLSDSTYIVATDNDVGQNNIYHLDANGNVIGTGLMPFQYIKDVVQGKDGNIYYCGYACDACWDSFVIGKTNEMLDTIYWIHSFGTNGGNWGDWFSNLYVLPDTNILVTGRFPLNLLKINFQTGDSIWNKYIAGSQNPFFPLRNSTLIVGDGYFLDKINYAGDTLWEKRLRVNQFDYLIINSLVQLNDGCIASLGYKEHYIGQGNYVLYPFFAYFDSTFSFPLNVGFGDLQQGTEVTVFPNPVTWQSTLTFANELHEAVDFTLYDVTGKAIERQQTNDAQFIITGNNRSGLFIYELNFSNGFVQRGKVVFAN